METSVVESKRGGALAHTMGGWEDIDTRDLLIGRVLLMQGPSKLVQEEKAKFGEIRNSLTGELLAGRGEKFEFVPFRQNKTWVLLNTSGQFVREVPLRDHLDWVGKREIVEGTETLRVYETQNFLVLTTKQVEQGARIPLRIAFRATSYYAAKQLTSLAVTAADIGLKNMWDKTYILSSELVENEKGKFYRFVVGEGRPTTDAEKAVIARSQELVGQANLVFDDTVEDIATAPVDDVGTAQGKAAAQEFQA